MDIKQENFNGNNIVNIGTQKRNFDDISKLQLKNMIGKNDKILIMAVMNDPEASLFAETVKKYLVTEGYSVEGVNYAIWPFPVNGLHVNEIDENGKRDVIIGHNA